MPDSTIAAPNRTIVPWLTALLSDLAARLERLPRWQFLAASTGLSLGLSVFFFSPKFWLLNHPRPGTFEWDRALTFLHQCHSPFATDIEGAMRWRLLPPLIAHGLGLTGYSAFLISYAGIAAFVVGWCAVAERLLADRLSALLLTVLLGTTAAVISVTTVYGVNDGWFLLGLLAVAGGRRWPSLVLPGLLACWVDERFLLGWPVALFCRWWLQGRPARFNAQIISGVASLVPYVLVRGGYTLLVNDRGSSHFLSDAISIVPIYLPFGRLGWWMGFRAAWPLLILAVYEWWQLGGRFALLVGVGTALAGWMAITLLAADLSRSTNLLLPLLLCGAVALRKFLPTLAAQRGWLATGVVANLAMPFLSVTYTKPVMIWSLPLELLRLWKN